MARLFKPFPVRILGYVGVGLLCVVAGVVAIYTSANGPWGYRDSAEYLSVARSLMHGLGYGFFLPNGQFHVYTIKPPLFSLVLSGIGLLHVDLVEAARWLNITLFVGTVFLGGWIFIRYSSSAIIAIPACLLLVTFPTMTMLFSSAMPEPLFIFLLLAGAFCLLEYFRKNSGRWLVLSAVFTSLLPMTRYIGIAVIPVGFFSIFLFLNSSWKERLKKAALYAVLTSLPFLIWECWVYFRVDRTFAGRSLLLNWNTMQERFSASYWLINRYIGSWLPFGKYILGKRHFYLEGLILFLLATLTVLTLLAGRRMYKNLIRARNDGDVQIFGLFAFWSLFYILVYLADWLVNQDTDPVTNRLLLPVFVGMILGLMGALACFQNAWFRGRLRWLSILAWLIAVSGVLWYSPQTINEIIIPFHQGRGETPNYWRNSETLAAVRRLPKDALIASDDAPAILLWTDRPAYVIITGPNFFYTQGTTLNTESLDNSIALATFQKQGVYLVLFSGKLNGASVDNTPEADLAGLKTVFGNLTPFGEYADGAIYYSPP